MGGRAGHRNVYALIGALTLMTVGLASGCSSGGGSSLSSECFAARQRFVDFVNATADRSNSTTNAANHWSDIYNRAVNDQLSAEDLATAISEYDTDLRAASTSQTTATEESTAFLKAMGACDQSTLPNACRDEFAQYQPNVEHEAREATSYQALLEAIKSQQNAIQAQDRTAMNAATEGYNSALAQVDATQEEHQQLHTQFQAAQQRCNDA
jgi:chromosome segregation ATPase